MRPHTSPSPPHILRHVGDGVKHGVHGVDVCELHQLAVGELAALVKLAAAVARLKDVEGGDLGEGGGMGLFTVGGSLSKRWDLGVEAREKAWAQGACGGRRPRIEEWAGARGMG